MSPTTVISGLQTVACNITGSRSVLILNIGITILTTVLEKALSAIGVIEHARHMLTIRFSTRVLVRRSDTIICNIKRLILAARKSIGEGHGGLLIIITQFDSKRIETRVDELTKH